MKLYGLNPKYRGDVKKKHFRFTPVKLLPDAMTHTGSISSRECLEVFIKGRYYYSNAICAN